MSGVLQIGVGFLRAGWLLSLVNAPVLMAFTQGAGLLIIGSQVLTLLGLPNDWSQLLKGPALHLPSLTFGIGSYIALALLRRWSRTFPSVLVLVVAAALISVWSGFEASGGLVIGDLPTGLPPLSVPSWPGMETLASLLLPALMITLVSFLETASSARIDSRDQGQRWNREQDLIGHGLAKMVAGLSGAFPTSTSFSRSVLNRYAGARTGWSVIFSCAVVALALVFTPMLHAVPMPVLAAIVVAAVQSLLAPSEFVKLWRVSRVEAGIAVVTFVITVLSAPRLYWGVLAGVVMSLSRFLFLRLNPRIIEVGLHSDGSLRDRHLWNLPPLAPLTYAFRMDADLDFASANDFERNVSQYLASHPETRNIILIAHPINQIDATGVETLGMLLAQLTAQNITVHLVGLKLPVEGPLRAGGLLAPSDHLKTYRTESEVLSAAKSFMPSVGSADSDESDLKPAG